MPSSVLGQELRPPKVYLCLSPECVHVERVARGAGIKVADQLTLVGETGLEQIERKPQGP